MPPPPTLPQKYSLPLYSMPLRNRGVWPLRVPDISTLVSPVLVLIFVSTPLGLPPSASSRKKVPL